MAAMNMPQTEAMQGLSAVTEVCSVSVGTQRMASQSKEEDSLIKLPRF